MLVDKILIIITIRKHQALCRLPTHFIALNQNPERVASAHIHSWGKGDLKTSNSLPEVTQVRWQARIWGPNWANHVILKRDVCEASCLSPRPHQLTQRERKSLLSFPSSCFFFFICGVFMNTLFSCARYGNQSSVSDCGNRKMEWTQPLRWDSHMLGDMPPGARSRVRWRLRWPSLWRDSKGRQAIYRTLPSDNAGWEQARTRERGEGQPIWKLSPNQSVFSPNWACALTMHPDQERCSPFRVTSTPVQMEVLGETSCEATLDKAERWP